MKGTVVRNRLEPGVQVLIKCRNGFTLRRPWIQTIGKQARFKRKRTIRQQGLEGETTVHEVRIQQGGDRALVERPVNGPKQKAIIGFVSAGNHPIAHAKHGETTPDVGR